MKAKILYGILLALLLWAMATTLIFNFKNPKATYMETFLHIPKSFILDFEWGEK
jgi:hypothetical protein